MSGAWVWTTLLLVASLPAHAALDYFELETYSYQTAGAGETELEGSVVDTGPAQTTPDGSVARTALEVNQGVTDHTDLAAYLDLARAPGGAWREDGVRLHAHTRFLTPSALPFNLGAYAEVEWPRHEPDHAEGEVRAILEKDMGRLRLDINPIFHHTLSGPDTSAGWDIGYALAIIYRPGAPLHPRLDLFGDAGPVTHISHGAAQEQLLSPALEWRLSPGASLTAGVGFGLTPATDHFLVRAGLECELD